MELFLLKVLATLVTLQTALANFKTWNKDVNFDNKENWDRTRLPCPLDTVVIPEESTSVFLQMNGTLKELILPMQGEIVLGSDLTLTFSDDASLVDTSCTGQDTITFSRKLPEPWLNPNNWDSDPPVPIETDKVPCEFDDVLFPPSKRFSVAFEGDFKASTLTMGGQKLVSPILDSSSGLSQFSFSDGSSLSLSGLKCGDTTGCECGNDRVKKTICSYVGSCPSVPCEQSVVPVGACCPLCGGFLTLSYDERVFDFDAVKAKLYKDYNLGSGSSRMVKRQTDDVVVNMYMSKTAPGQVQVVLTDNGNGTDNGKLSSQLAQQITEDIKKDPSAFGLVSFSVAVSAPLTTTGVSGAVTAVVIVALVVGIILAVSIVYVMFRRQPLRFRKDEPLDAEMEMKETYKKEIPPEVAFDNPMYGTPIKEKMYDDPAKGSADVEDVGSIDECDLGFSNPMAVATN